MTITFPQISGLEFLILVATILLFWTLVICFLLGISAVYNKNREKRMSIIQKNKRIVDVKKIVDVWDSLCEISCEDCNLQLECGLSYIREDLENKLYERV